MLLQSASTHAMIAAKDLDGAKEFYAGTLGLVRFDERPGSAIRYEMRGGTWFMIYQSEFAGTAQSTCMKFEVDECLPLSSSCGDVAWRSRNATCPA
jgi:catechol 2,3-dioxygenase-like lactoylglutathione lyase family enzyme